MPTTSNIHPAALPLPFTYAHPPEPLKQHRYIVPAGSERNFEELEVGDVVNLSHYRISAIVGPKGQHYVSAAISRSTGKPCPYREYPTLNTHAKMPYFVVISVGEYVEVQRLNSMAKYDALGETYYMLHFDEKIFVLEHLKLTADELQDGNAAQP